MRHVISLLFGVLMLVLPLTAGHALATHGKPKYGADFTHFAYVNPHAPKGGTLKMGTVGTFNSLNPFILKGTPAPGLPPLHASFAFGTLTTKSDDEPATEYGYIAEDISLASDRSFVDFRMRTQAKFSDGSAITAHDVVFSFTMFKTKGTPLFRQYYKDITKAEALNTHTVRFHIGDRDNRELPVIIGHMPIISKKFWSTRDFATDTTSIPVSSGPYMIKSVTMGKEIVFERIKGWWGENLPPLKGRFNCDTVSMRTMMDDSVMFEAFKAGRFNFRSENAVQRWQKGYNFPAVTRGDVRKRLLAIAPFTGCSVVHFNLRRNTLQPLAIRRALQVVFDFPRINRTYFASLNRDARSYFAGSHFEGNNALSAAEKELIRTLALSDLPEEIEKAYHISNAKTNQRDRLVYAQKILLAAGYHLKNGKLYAPNAATPVVLDLIYPAGSHAYDKIMLDIARNAKRLGITLALRTLEPAQLVHKQNTFDFDLIVSASVQSHSPANEQRNFWGCKAAKIQGSKNLSGLCDANVDTVIESVIDAATLEELRPRVQLLDRLLLHGYIGIPLWHTPVLKLAMRKEIKLPKTINQATQFDLYSLWIDEETP